MGENVKVPSPKQDNPGVSQLSWLDVENEGEARVYKMGNSTLELGRQTNDVFKEFALKSSYQGQNSSLGGLGLR